jgi:hypothetical protein
MNGKKSLRPSCYSFSERRVHGAAKASDNMCEEDGEGGGVFDELR